MRLILIGPPGAGKGTQAVRLAARLRLPHISTGELFREHLRDSSPLGEQAKRYLDAGALVPDNVTVGMVRDQLTHIDAVTGFILDGFPRTLAQADSLLGILRELDAPLDTVIELTLPEELVVRRLLARGRDDDSEDLIRRRQKIYRDDTTPLLAFYRDQLVSVDAVGTIDEVTERVLDKLSPSPAQPVTNRAVDVGCGRGHIVD
jgi:adenylate kinase